MHKKNKKKHESRLLEAPFVRSLRMQSASLKMIQCILKENDSFFQQLEKPKYDKRSTDSRFDLMSMLSFSVGLKSKTTTKMSLKPRTTNKWLIKTKPNKHNMAHGAPLRTP